MKFKNEIHDFVFLAITVKTVIMAIVLVQFLFLSPLNLGSFFTFPVMVGLLISLAKTLGLLIFEWIVIMHADGSKVFSFLLIFLGFVNVSTFKILGIIIGVIYILYGLICLKDLQNKKVTTTDL